MRNNYIFIDYENVQNIDLTFLKEKSFYIKIFIGTNQTKIPIDLVLKSQALGNQVEWIQINGNGKNALDFHIAFELGKLVEKEAKSFFHIISKDTGYDPLISYMKSQKIFCKRSEDIGSLIKSLQTGLQSVVPPQKNSSTDQIPTQTDLESRSLNKQIDQRDNQYDQVVKRLSLVNKVKRPKSESSLKNHIKSQLGLKEQTPIVNKIYQQLISTQKISLDRSNKIIYNF
ncbi:PIN domain-containing protein [Pseudanabaena sp. 'Roaring Creek']|uniref:PIN domain-containing protein n=1 Tax=Pseudanabaena sp. 'Roaring Creek' TaxID=1681830 RepID=UPI0006D844C8|nr:PIN domain-containing protein [Pseudanabaena sp. 'Roaring Creek']